mmetsp:Transcript_8468/g.25109  ORF Transcript_8468/g.25109 Transcript_8468/m.25109 type:complete len:238 (+) Transcript_8468:273-986(+)
MTSGMTCWPIRTLLWPTHSCRSAYMTLLLNFWFGGAWWCSQRRHGNTGKSSESSVLVSGSLASCPMTLTSSASILCFQELWYDDVRMSTNIGTPPSRTTTDRWCGVFVRLTSRYSVYSVSASSFSFNCAMLTCKTPRAISMVFVLSRPHDRLTSAAVQQMRSRTQAPRIASRRGGTSVAWTCCSSWPSASPPWPAVPSRICLHTSTFRSTPRSGQATRAARSCSSRPARAARHSAAK